MANITVSNSIYSSIDMSNEEIEIVKKAYRILKDIANELWRNDADETETFENTSTACDCIYAFMKNDIGHNIDEKRHF